MGERDEEHESKPKQERTMIVEEADPVTFNGIPIVYRTSFGHWDQEESHE